MRPKQKSQRQLELEVENFNLKFKVGDTVRVIDDRGAEFIDTIKYPASIMGGHSSMMWLDNVGSYQLDRLIKI